LFCIPHRRNPDGRISEETLPFGREETFPRDISLKNKMAEGFLTWLLDVVSGYVSDIAIHVMVLIYAPYKSIKAIRSPDEEDDKQWLTFW
jgi:hypothetical protein